MRIPRRSRLVAWLAFGLAAFLAGPAGAVPLQYTFSATLVLASSTDSLDLDGASLTITVDADSSAAPTSTASGTNMEQSFYGVTATAVFSNRPNAAPDEVVVYTSNLLVTNHFPPSPGSDQFGLQSSNASFPSVTLAMPGIGLSFTDSAFLPGTGSPALPVFAPSDLASVSAAQLHQQPTLPIYDLEELSITVVPEPTPAWLLLLGLLGLSARRPRPRA
jgi:hypothetical protein